MHPPKSASLPACHHRLRSSRSETEAQRNARREEVRAVTGGCDAGRPRCLPSSVALRCNYLSHPAHHISGGLQCMLGRRNGVHIGVRVIVALRRTSPACTGFCGFLCHVLPNLHNSPVSRNPGCEGATPSQASLVVMGCARHARRRDLLRAAAPPAAAHERAQDRHPLPCDDPAPPARPADADVASAEAHGCS